MATRGKLDTMPHAVNSLHSAAAAGYTITLWCKPCRRTVGLPPEKLRAMPDVNYIEDRARLRCSVCGGQVSAMTMYSDGRPYDGPR